MKKVGELAHLLGRPIISDVEKKCTKITREINRSHDHGTKLITRARHELYYKNKQVFEQMWLQPHENIKDSNDVS